MQMRATGVNLHWLLTGDGPMLLKDVEGQVAALDMERLVLALETVEEGLEMTGRTMEPGKKAELVAAVYDLFEDRKPSEKESVLRLVKSAM